MSRFVSQAGLILALGVGSLAVGLPQLMAQEAGSLQISAGFGISYADDGGWGEGYGGVALLEYVGRWTDWVGGRLYAGGFLSASHRESCPPDVEPCAVSARIGLAGAKGRILIPFPYFGPFVELGLGLSAGSIETRIGGRGFRPPVDKDGSGVFFHIPMSVGLAFGVSHQHELVLDYFLHRSQEHVAASLAIGIGFSWE